MIEFDEEDNEVKCKTILNHKDEIWDLKPCPFDKSVLATCSGVARAWRISGEDEEEEQKEEGKNTSGPELQEIVTFKSDKETKRILWEPIEEKRKDAVCITFHEDGFQMWSLEYGSDPILTKRTSKSNDKIPKMSAASWDPIHLKQICTSNGTSVYGWDLRSAEQTHHIQSAHRMGVRDIDFNVNKPWALVTGGDDGEVKFWDLRNSSKALKVLNAHRHWVTCAKYSPNHDQLVLTASTDHMVKLWRVSSISSAPLQQLEEDRPVNTPDGMVKCFDDHEDSVYSIAWSSYEPWVFASLSYDGRVVVGNVPSAEKYKILLD